MLSGLTHILSRIKPYIWWLTKSGNIREKCHDFCPNCYWYEYCVADERGLIDEEDYRFYDGLEKDF